MALVASATAEATSTAGDLVVGLASAVTAEATATAGDMTGIGSLTGSVSAAATATADLIRSTFLAGAEMEFDMAFSAGLSLQVPPADPPSTYLEEVLTIPRISPFMPVPQLDENGRPS